MGLVMATLIGFIIAKIWSIRDTCAHLWYFENEFYSSSLQFSTPPDQSLQWHCFISFIYGCDKIEMIICAKNRNMWLICESAGPSLTCTSDCLTPFLALCDQWAGLISCAEFFIVVSQHEAPQASTFSSFLQACTYCDGSKDLLMDSVALSVWLCVCVCTRVLVLCVCAHSVLFEWSCLTSGYLIPLPWNLMETQLQSAQSLTSLSLSVFSSLSTFAPKYNNTEDFEIKQSFQKLAFPHKKARE